MTNHHQTKVAVYAAQMPAERAFGIQHGIGILCIGLATLLSALF